MIEPNRIGWSEPREGMLIGVVDNKIAALFYWHPQSRSWFWIPADRPYESFHVVHGEPRARSHVKLFLARTILSAYLDGMDPGEAGELKWPPESWHPAASQD